MLPVLTYSRCRAMRSLLQPENPSCESLLKILTRLYRKGARQNGLAPSCISNADVAEEVARRVRDRQENKDSVMIINNPGSVEFVRKFKALGVKHIACTALEKQNGGDIKRGLEEEGALVSSINVMTATCNQLEQELVTRLPVPVNESGVTIISSLSEPSKAEMHQRVFNTLVGKCLGYPGLLDTPKTELFIFLTHNKYKVIESKPWLFSYKIYHAFFNISHVMQLDGTDFDPVLVAEKGSKAAEDCRVDLVHFRPNQAVLSQLALEDRARFKKFVSFCSRKDTIITFLERCVPGCGIHLIKMGFTMSDENITMTPQQYFNIYKSLSSWPEYEDSSLKLLLEDKPIPVLAS